MNIKAISMVCAVVVVTACGDSGDNVAKQAGEKVGSLVTEFAEGAGKGIDQKMQVNVTLSEEFGAHGMRYTVAKQDNLAEKSVVIYFIADKAFKGQVQMKALNASGEEIGRSIADVDFAADDAQYVTFTFNTELDTQMVATYSATLKPAK